MANKLSKALEDLDFEVAMSEHDQAPYDRIAMDWFQEEVVPVSCVNHL